MKKNFVRIALHYSSRIVVVWLAASCLLSAAAFQTAPLPGALGQLRGEVTDPSGAVIAGAQVSVISPTGVAASATTNRQGEFLTAHLRPGAYQVVVQAAGFTPWQNKTVRIAAGRSINLRIRLSLALQHQRVVVHPPAAVRLHLAPAQNASALKIQGKALQDLSNDPTELLSQLQELAGPAAGPNGATIYIDGFSGGDLPPKSAILAVRVNSDPFSAAHARLGYGRVEIITRPGKQKIHGGISVYGNTSALNARSPFLAGTTLPPYHTLLYGAHLGGGLGAHTSWFFALQRRDINHDQLIHTEILNPSSLAPETFTAAVPAPRLLNNVSLRIDRQLTSRNTLMARYNYFGADTHNNGVGGQALATQGYQFARHHHLFQLADTQVLGSNGLNQFRLQFLHFSNLQQPVSTNPTLQVLGAFTGGGNSGGYYHRAESHYQAFNVTSYTWGQHQAQFGESLRNIRRSEENTGNFNGTFFFNSLADYSQTEMDLRQGMSMQQIQAAGYGPSQFNLTSGVPLAAVIRWDAAFFAQDDWRIRPSLNLTYGLRLESENKLHDHDDWAPRLGLAWGVSKNMILRAGAGIFYDRLDDDQMIQVERLNGINQITYQVTNPDFYPSFPPPSTLKNSAAAPTTYMLASNLRSPYAIEAAASVERQLGKNATLTLTYLHSSGQRQFLSNDINAPLPGTYNPAQPGSGVRPLGAAAGNIYAYESQGIFRQNQLIANFKVRERTMSWFGYYTWNDAHSDANGINSFATNPWNLMEDYGRAAFNIRQRLFLGGNLELPWGLQLFPMVIARSGIPFSITLSQDLFGTGIHNSRPAPATPGTPSADLRVTPYGNFNIAPAPGAAMIAPNTATGPPAFTMNLRLTKTFGLGPLVGGHHGGGGGPHYGGHDHDHHRGLGPGGLGGGMGGGPAGGADHRYALTANLSVRNLFNFDNLGIPVGNLNSPFFGQSISLAGGPYAYEDIATRMVELGLSFSF